VTAVEDGLQAYDLAFGAWREKDPYDIVLMDMQMPVMDGYTATSKLRSQGYAGIIIALTAHAMKEDRERCIRVGCDEYATKPVNVPALLQSMAALAGKSKAVTTAGITDRMQENPALWQLTRKFCDGLTATLESMRQFLRDGKLDELSVAAHRLAGAGGAYGFDDISREAKALERAARSMGKEDVQAALEGLVRAGQAAQQRVSGTSVKNPQLTA
jgi:CheY-like chemotaxis protein